MMKKLLVTFILLLSLSFSSHSQEVKSPADFLGYEIGTQFTRHADVVRYFEHLAQHSPYLEFHQYGQTNERRVLGYSVISSQSNLQELEFLRQQHLATTGLAPEQSSEASKAVVWLSYNVHGNEASSTEAALLTAYELVSNRTELLEELIVIIDPGVNPDGRDRYVNWYNQVKSTPYNKLQLAAEHHEPWPGGRPNHYLLYLNRDWMWATQVETRQRLEIYNQWLPHIHVDFHEQGINEPYYFAPAAKPFHNQITEFQREFQTEIGKNHAQYFDKEGWLFFTRERFDLLYPSYGDTYPTFMGAIGMTYEQAGHGRAGLAIDTDEGYELTLKDRVEHHLTTGISTLEVAARNSDRLVREFKEFYSNPGGQTKAYALRGSTDKLKVLTVLLDRHEIQYGQSESNRIRGYHYQKDQQSGFSDATSSLIIPTTQPKGRMVEVLFEPATSLEDSLTYDITAWSLPYAYGLEAVSSNRELDYQAGYNFDAVSNTASPSGAGYLAKWDSMDDARFLASLLQEGIRVRFSEQAFQNGNQHFQPGSLIITKSDNRHVEDFDTRLMELANKHQRQLSPASTSLASSGPDFGSPNVKIINSPRIAVLRGQGVSSLNYGEIWYFFEQELGYPLTTIDTDYFNPDQLADLDVLILPAGRYAMLLQDSSMTRIKEWIRKGGKIIALSGSIGTFADKDGFELSRNKQSSQNDSLQTKDLIPYAQQERENIKHLITGSIIETQIDSTHPMAFGYGQTYYSMKLGTDSYSFLKNGSNVGYVGSSPKVISGFAGIKAREKIKNSMSFGVEQMGRGSLIYLVDNPLFRGFWENGKLLFTNALFFVNNDRIQN